MSGNNIQKFDNAVRVGNFPSAPASTPAGAIYWDTTANELFVSNGTSYSPLAISTNEFLTNVFRLDDNTDPTKKIAFSAAGITTGTVRTITMPDANVDLGNLTNSNISASAAIAYSKLNLSNSIVNADINASAAIAYSKLNLSGSIVNADINASAAIALSKLAALSNNFALQSNGSGVISVSAVTSTELGYVSGVTSAIQTQLNGKPATASVILVNGSQPWSANQSLGGNVITNSGTPTNPNDLTSKVYVDNLVQGLNWKNTTVSATTTTLPANTYNNGTAGVGATLTGNSNGALTAQDGVTLTSGQRLLVKDEATSANNGIYTLTQVGSGGTPYILTRAVDADTPSKLQWATVEVGPDATTQGGYIFREADDITTIGTDPVVFTNISQGASLVFTSGTQLIGNTVSAKVDNSTIDVNGSQQLEVKAGGITNTQVSASAAIAYSKLNLSGSIVNADINASAAIAYSKLNLTGSIVNADINASAAIVYSKLSLSNSIVNADINTSAAIAYSKLALTNSIVNADIASGAAIAYSKLNLSNSIVNADVATAAAIARSKLASGTNFAWVTNNGSGVMSETSVTASRAVATDSNGLPVASATTATQLGYLSTTTSDVQTQINGKLSSVSQDTAPTLGGDLTLNGKTLLGVERRGANNTATVQEEYLEFSLTQSTTAVASSLTFDSRNFKGLSVEYTISNGNDRRKGRLELACNNATGSDSTVISLTDQSTETADVLVSWSAAMNSHNVELSYTTGAGTFNMDADIKRFRS